MGRWQHLADRLDPIRFPMIFADERYVEFRLGQIR